MGANTKFLRQFFKDRQMVGAVAPSTKFLAEKMLKHIDFDKAKVIVELGPGNGVFTEIMLQRMSPDAKLFVFELNEEFHKDVAAKINDPRAHIIHDSAENIEKYVTEAGTADAVVSSLPLMVFPEELRASVVKAAHTALHEEGNYVQFQYSLQSKRYLQSIFSKVNIQFTIRNLPPAFVYTCKK
ncbi:MAG: rRNA adenine N-6-methyltransferase family protein [Crocinitomicaceae bacterium]